MPSGLSHHSELATNTADFPLNALQETSTIIYPQPNIPIKEGETHAYTNRAVGFVSMSRACKHMCFGRGNHAARRTCGACSLSREPLNFFTRKRPPANLCAIIGYVHSVHTSQVFPVKYSALFAPPEHVIQRFWDTLSARSQTPSVFVPCLSPFVDSVFRRQAIELHYTTPSAFVGISYLAANILKLPTCSQITAGLSTEKKKSLGQC